MNTPTRPEDEAWAELTPHDVQQLLSRVPLRWWIAGGWALDVEGRRTHGDIDVAVLRSEHEALRQELRDWDLQIAFQGKLRPWLHGPVGPPEHTVWARPTPHDPWHIDFKIETVDDGDWVFWRDPNVRRPIEQIGYFFNGIPFLARDLAVLYKERLRGV